MAPTCPSSVGFVRFCQTCSDHLFQRYAWLVIVAEHPRPYFASLHADSGAAFHARVCLDRVLEADPAAKIFSAAQHDVAELAGVRHMKLRDGGAEHNMRAFTPVFAGYG